MLKHIKAVGRFLRPAELPFALAVISCLFALIFWSRLDAAAAAQFAELDQNLIQFICWGGAAAMALCIAITSLIYERWGRTPRKE